jgi:tetratricopeptide (TPR) repeat protein
MSIEIPRILSLFAAPLVGPDGAPLDTLDVQKERDTLVRELGACNRDMTLRVRTATVDELSRGIADNFNILHFSGHGHGDFLVFEDGKGGSQLVSGEFLKKLIGAAGPFELAIVSACHSEKTGNLIVQAGVRHVVAIRQDVPVLDSAAIVFIGEFFRHLFRRVPIQKAFELGKLLVEGNPHLTEMKPQLEAIALIEGERFVPEEKKFVLLPASDPSPHLVELVAEEVAEGVLTVEEPRLSRTNLPTRPGVFTGRSKEIFDLVNEVLTTRLVTITGTGGIGKTVVAREVARWFHSRGHFPDGVISIDLRHAETIEEITAILGVSLEAEFSDMEDAVRYLRERQCLLLLDNAEDALWRKQATLQSLVNAILEHAPKVKLLITSQREVGGNLHEPELVYRLRTIEANHAAMLFVAAAKRRISVEEVRSKALYSLLNELGGHPLSIVLMARQLGPGTEIVDLLQRIQKQKSKAIEVRSITDRDPEHGESLVASLSAAYHNLSVEGKRAFAALTMMPAGSQDFTMQQVLGDGGWEFALEINDASLAEITAYRRVVLIPPVRLFADSVLTDELKEELGPKIVRAMAGYANQFYHQMGSPDAREYRRYFALEEANFLAATQLPCSQPENDRESSLLGILAASLLPLYGLTDRQKEAGQTGERLMAALQRLGDKLGQANTLRALGELAMRTDDLKDAKDKYVKALEIYEQIDAKLGEANTLQALGDLAVRTDDLKDAKDKYVKALEIYEQIDEKLGEANTLRALGDLAVRTDDLKDAKDKYAKALEIFEQIDAKLGEANTLQVLGDLAVRTDDLKDAKDKYVKALEIYEQIDAKLGEANTLRSMAQLSALESELGGADLRLNEASEIYAEIDDLEGKADVAMTRAFVLIQRGNHCEARERLGECSSIRRNILGYGQVADWLIFYSDHLKGKGLEEGAATCLEYAREFASGAADSRLIREIDKRLGP